MRDIKQILKEEHITESKVWYDRHQMLMEKVHPKDLKDKNISDELLFVLRKKGFIKGAIKVAKEMEKLYGKKNMGPYTEMEWGILCGRLETLRWVLGEDWGMLDT